MREAGGGAIVNLSSISYMMGNAGYPVYTTANSGLNGMVRSLAREFGSLVAQSCAKENGSSLVVMTGETGAGKSIMLRAIHLLSGRRASVDWIRSGAESCEVEALFELHPGHRQLLQKLEDGGFASGTSIVIKRIVSSSGRSRFYVNGSLATARIVSELALELLSVASQHDHQQQCHISSHVSCLER